MSVSDLFGCEAGFDARQEQKEGPRYILFPFGNTQCFEPRHGYYYEKIVLFGKLAGKEINGRPFRTRRLEQAIAKWGYENIQAWTFSYPTGGECWEKIEMPAEWEAPEPFLSGANLID